MILAALNFGCEQTPVDFDPCDALTKVDREMLDLVAEIEKDYKDDEVFITAFKESQIYWTQYRNRQVKAVFPLSPRKYDFDVGECKCELMSAMTSARIEELKKWTIGIGSNHCHGTYKVKRN